MARPDARKLKDEAAAYVTRGKWAKALENYMVLETLEPRDGTWAQKAGEMYRRLGKNGPAIDALTRAATVYSASGFLLKAVAVNKLILEIDPARTDVQAKLASLHAARMRPEPRMATIVAAAVPPPAHPDAPPPPPPPPARSVASAAVPVPIGPAPTMRSANPPVGPAPSMRPAPPPAAPPPAPLVVEELPLSAAVPGARKSDEIRTIGDSAAYEIPLGDDDVEILDEEIVAEGPTAADQARELLPRTPLFSSLDEDRLRALIEAVELRRLADGEVLFRRGDPADALYVVAAGEVAVLAPGAGGVDVEVARLREGAFFGEIALLTSGPRSATIRGAAETDLLVIERPIVAALVRDAPGVLQVLLRFMRDRLLDTLVETNPLFAPFSGPDRRALAARFVFLEVDRGLTFVEQGQRAPGLFIVLAGRVEIAVDDQPRGELGPGGFVGQSSLLAGGPSPATARARTKLLLLELRRADFQEVIMTHPQVLEYIGAVADEAQLADGALRVV
jgi:CRP-like cAMP-binding protein